jgi:membrane protease YdiL (CAAX protease family)
MPWDIALILFLLAVVLPWRGRAKMKKLLAMPQVTTMERLTLYASTIAFQWLAAGVVAWRTWVHRYSSEQLGLVLHDKTRILVASLVGGVAIAIFQWFNLQRVAKLPMKRRATLVAIAQRIFPHSMVEFLPYVALAITAGLCEEFLYRGFSMAVFTRAGLPVWAVVLLSSVLFGLAHLYQGRGGAMATLVVGTVLGMARIAYDSLVPVIVWHTALDVVAGVAGPRYLTAASAEPAQEETEAGR